MSTRISRLLRSITLAGAIWANSALAWVKDFKFPTTVDQGDALELFAIHVILPNILPGVCRKDINWRGKSRDPLHGGQDSFDIDADHGSDKWAVQCKNEATPFDYLDAEGYVGVFRKRQRTDGYTGLIVVSMGGFTQGALDVLNEVGAIALDYRIMRRRRIDTTLRKFQNLMKRDEIVPKRPRFKLRPHQKRAIDKLIRSDVARGQIHHATGAGKTLIASRTAKRLGAERIIGFEPSIHMVGQQGVNYSRELPTHRLLCVCSSEPRVRGTALGVPITNDPAVIRRFITDPGPFILMSTLMSARTVIKALRLAGFPVFEGFDLGLFDEGHNFAVQSLQANREPRPFAKPLFDRFIPVDKRIFFTATPKFVTKELLDKAIAKGNPLDAVCMSDTTLFGPVIDEYTLTAAIEDKVVSNFDVLIGILEPTHLDPVSGLSFRDDLVMDITDGRQKHHFTDRFGDPNIPESMLAAYNEAHFQFFLKQCDMGGSYLTFHNSVRNAGLAEKWVKLLAAEAGITVRTATVHAHTSADDREDALDLLEIKDSNEIHVVFNCDVFSEGVDTPALDGVCYFDPRQSTVSIGQGNGRALRYQGDTKRAKIILPILAPDIVTAEDFVRSSKYANLYAVTAALRHLGVVLSDPIYCYSSSASPITVKAQKHVGVYVTTPESYDHVLLRSVISHLILNGPNVALTDVEVADRYISFWKSFNKVPKRTRSRTLVENVEDTLARQFETLDEEAKRIFIHEGDE